jgi:potassium voltage-gated channel subfamily G protein 3
MRRTFEEPGSSVAAQLLALLSVIFVIVSMVMLCMSTLPDWNTAKHNTVEEHRYTHTQKSTRKQGSLNFSRTGVFVCV